MWHVWWTACDTKFLKVYNPFNSYSLGVHSGYLYNDVFTAPLNLRRRHEQMKRTKPCFVGSGELSVP